MATTYEKDLINASDALESLLEQLPKLKLEAKVDLCARVKALTKNAEKIDKLVKDEIKAKLRHKDGTVLGEVFKANLAVIPTDRLDQSALKEGKPAIYAAYLKSDETERVTLSPGNISEIWPLMSKGERETLLRLTQMVYPHITSAMLPFLSIVIARTVTDQTHAHLGHFYDPILYAEYQDAVRKAEYPAAQKLERRLRLDATETRKHLERLLEVGQNKFLNFFL